MISLITDRTEAHVSRLKSLLKKNWSDMTNAEQVEYREYAAKGAYNYTDLNRVESAVAEIAPYLGLTLTTKTNWGLWDIPLKVDMERYLSNVVAIRNACPDSEDIPSPPSSMSKLTYEGANNIEKILVAAYERIGRGYRSGELYSGEV